MHEGPHPPPPYPPERTEAEAEENAAFEEAFIAGLRAAADKQVFLALCRVPMSVPANEGGPPLKLVEVRIEEGFVVGVASPGFGARELVHQPLPGPLIRHSTRLDFLFVSLDERRTLTLAELRLAGAELGER